MRSLSSIFLSIIVCLSFFISSAQAFEIIYPGDKTVVLRSDFLIIKGGNQPVFDEMIVEVNGVASDPLNVGDDAYKAAFADFLILEPEWKIGKNAIVVKGMVNGQVVATVKADIFYAGREDTLNIIPSGYKPFVMHTAEKEALCAPCHNMQPTDAQLRGAISGNNPCGSCHSRMMAQKFVHGPDGVFQCIDCHDSQGTAGRWQVTKSELILCGECHTDKIEELKNSPFVHGPVAVGNCIVCHDPHASDQPAQLEAPINLICVGCHGAIKEGNHVVRGVAGKGHPLSTVADPLRPGNPMSCVSCHNPHSGKSAQFYSGGVVSRFALCQKCHKK